MMGEALELFDQNPSTGDIFSEVLEGLSIRNKRLPPKFFYDRRGSLLFDEITKLPEYYLTRSEVAILEENKGEIASIVGHEACVVEYGSGASTKIRILLEGLKPSAYVPVDISRDHLMNSSAQIAVDYPNVSVFPTCADYTERFRLPAQVDGLRPIAFFPGSSIGNFEPNRASEFIDNVRNLVGRNGLFLIGVDAKKDATTLNAAYNDTRGVTESFNLNMLRHLNERIGTNFDLDGFKHFAAYNQELGCVQMHLESKQKQQVLLDNYVFDFDIGERIHTESSYKYTTDEFLAMAYKVGFKCQSSWTDDKNYFNVFLLVATG